MRRIQFLIGMAALVSLLLVSAASAGRGGADRPFTARLTGAVTFAIGPGVAPSYCGGFTTNTHASGQVSHLGRVEVVTSHCPMDVDNQHDGYMTMTAANGDELYGTYDYTGESDNTLWITITGGSGRLAEASGTIFEAYAPVPQFLPSPPCNPETDIFGCLNPYVPWPWSATMSGTISY